jgi:cytosine/adenosine deaminase-related metal-dependent hydrolase
MNTHPEVCDLLIRNGYVVTMDGGRRVFPTGAVAVDGKRVVAVGPEREVAATWRGRRVIDAGGAPVHPGLIDGHYHVTMHGTRGAMSDDPSKPALGGASGISPYGQWFNAMTAEDEYASAQHASLEMLANGYTCFLEAGTVFETDAVAEAVTALGIRAVLGDPFLWDLTGGMAMAGELDRAPADLARCLSVMGRECRRNEDPDALVRGHIAVYGSGSASDDLLLAGKEAADRHGVVLNQHQSLEAGGVAREDERLGRHPFVHFAELGLLAENTTYVHLNILREDEVEAIAGSGMNVIWHPANYQFYAVGRTTPPRIPDLHGRGVNIALGSDIAKLWTIGEGPLIGYLLAREWGGYLTAEAMFEMQTCAAARAAGLADRIGSLEVGKRADIVIRSQNCGESHPGLNPVQEMVLIGRTRTVDTVIVDGETVLRGGRAVHVDEGAVHAASRASARRLAAITGQIPGTIWPETA